MNMSMQLLALQIRRGTLIRMCLGPRNTSSAVLLHGHPPQAPINSWRRQRGQVCLQQTQTSFSLDCTGLVYRQNSQLSGSGCLALQQAPITMNPSQTSDTLKLQHKTTMAEVTLKTKEIARRCTSTIIAVNKIMTAA